MFPFFPPRVFGWSNNQTDIKQSNRRQLLYIGEPHKNTRLPMARSLRLICHCALRRRALRGRKTTHKRMRRANVW